MSATQKFAVISFSTRKPRVGPKVAALVKDIISNGADAKDGVEISFVDVADFNLPVYDEEVIPAMVPFKAAFANAHSIAWSKEIAKYDGYILVIPEYNFGLAGGTKNAIDYLYNDWAGKPAGIISYGIKGGTTASDQLDGTLKGMKLRVAVTRPALPFRDGVGPDLNLAMAGGELGGDTKKDIQAQSPSILKVFQEVKELFNAPIKAA